MAFKRDYPVDDNGHEFVYEITGLYNDWYVSEPYNSVG
jgi:hypothetical protein